MEFYRAYTYEDEVIEWTIYCDVLVMKFVKNITDQDNFFKLLNESIFDILDEFKETKYIEYLYIVTTGRYNIDTSMNNMSFRRGNEEFIGVEPKNFFKLIHSNLPREPIYRFKNQKFD